MKSIDKLREFVDDQFVISGQAYLQGMAIANSIEAEIAANYLELPVDADGVPIRVGDAITLPNGSRDDVRFITIRKYDTVFNERGWVPSQCTHVKPRTLEDVLIEYRLKAYNLYADQELTGDERVDEFKKLDAEYDSEIRELLGGDAE